MNNNIKHRNKYFLRIMYKYIATINFAFIDMKEMNYKHIDSLESIRLH